MPVKIKIGRYDYRITRADRFMDMGDAVRLISSGEKISPFLPTGALRTLEDRFERVNVQWGATTCVYSYDIPD